MECGRGGALAGRGSQNRLSDRKHGPNRPERAIDYGRVRGNIDAVPPHDATASSPTTPSPREGLPVIPATRRRAAATGTLLGVATVGLVLTRGIPATVRNLYPDTLPVHPYFVADHWLLLYIGLPLACLTAVTLLLLPGVFLALALGRDERFEVVLVKGLGLSLVLHFSTTALAKLVLPHPLNPGVFLGLVIGSGVATWGILLLRLRRLGERRWPQLDRVARRRLGWMTAMVVVAVVALVPVLFWQDMNPDGFEALEIGRSLSWTVLPRFLTKSGLVGLGIGMLPMAYPIHWFVMLFGPIEASTRLPMVLCLPVLFASVIALIELRSPRRLRSIEEASIVLALATFVVALSFSASYYPYFADIASPAAFETLTVTLMCGAAYFLWAEKPSWFIGFAVLCYLARPTGLLVIALLGLGLFLFVPESRRRTAALLAATIGLWGLLYAGYEVLIPALTGARPGYPAESILDRFRFIRVDDWRRLLFLIVPSGILPVVALFMFRRQDRIAKSLTLAILGYFLVFYFPAFTNLHHFAPIMVLPVAVVWRVILPARPRPWLTGAVIAGGLVALTLSLPRHFHIDRTMRRIGSATVYHIGEYGSADFAAHRASYEGQELLHALFPADRDVADPATEFVGGLQLVYYATHADGPGPATNYLVQPQSAAAPTGFSIVAADDIGAAYVRSHAEWERDRLGHAPTDYRSRVYAIPRETISRMWGVRTRSYTVDLNTLPGLWRLF